MKFGRAYNSIVFCGGWVVLKIHNSPEESITPVQPVKSLGVHFKDEPDIIPIPRRTPWIRLKTTSINFFKTFWATLCVPIVDVFSFCCNCGMRKPSTGINISASKAIVSRIVGKPESY